MFQKKEKQLMKFIQNFKINITEDDMFNLLKIKRRWPYYHPTQNDKQPTVEVISMYGQKHNYLNDEIFL